MLGWIRRRMVSKIFLGVALVASLAFVAISLRVGTHVEGALHKSSQESAVQMANMVRSSIEQAMLSGNGIKVKNLVEQLKQSVSNETEIRIYDPQGIEVFAAKPPAPALEAVPVPVAKALEGGARALVEAQVFRPIPMEQRCAREGCHDAGDRLRGVLAMRVAEKGCSSQRNAVVSDIVRSGFIHLMTARRSDHLDEFFADIREATPSIMGVAVYDNEGDPSFGRDMSELGIEAEHVLEAMSGGKAKRHTIEGGSLEIVPLEKQDRCIECHSQEEELRGALLVALRDPADPSRCDALELEALIDTSLRHIMTSELGRIIALFLDSIAGTAGVEELVLYDNAGRVYWNTTHEAPPEYVSAALASGERAIDLLGQGSNQRLRVVEPLKNSERCARCHGAEMPYRGLVEVSLSTKMAATTREESKSIVMMTTAMAALGILFVLIAFLQYLVVRPVREIAGAAASIGDGNLDVEVRHANNDGDEVARLGARINSMIKDLRTKFHLEKFVSKGAAEAARSGGLRTSAQGGERTTATVLFSDIRGFTAYSEKVSAENVVAMLNRLLRAQTDVVHEYGGDVDKFVGDELMATFQGEDACLRATECALGMIAAVHKVRETDLAVGIGISTGEVVLGAIGHEDRLDYTVIGDVVNTGARLCSAAEPDAIIVTGAVREQAESSERCRFESLEPIAVKGKEAPLQIYRVRSKL